MDVYLAAATSFNQHVLAGRKDLKQLYLLESFVNCSSGKVEKYIPAVGKFLLDSGAFTFISAKKGQKIDWLTYVDQYADFIKENNVRLFFELDVDKLVGYDAVLKLRQRLEARVGRQSIPVWHKTRGRQAFVDMCRDYQYVSIGGLVGGGESAGAYAKHLCKFFPWFIDTAHENSAKIHALGFTDFEGLKKYHFDSVDSSSWTSGHRFGGLTQFNGEKVLPIPKGKNQKMIDWKNIATHNFNEWVKFQQYAKENL
jgi:hypothetical protein